MGEEDWLLSPQAHSLSRNASLPRVPESLGVFRYWRG